MSNVGEANSAVIGEIIRSKNEAEEKVRRVEAFALKKSHSENPYDRIIAESIYRVLEST